MNKFELVACEPECKEKLNIHKISSYLSSFIADTSLLNKIYDHQHVSDIGNKEKTHKKERKTLPKSRHDFRARLLSFNYGTWTSLKVSPFICARYGWALIDKEILQCVTCQALLCTSLPPPSERDAYEKFLDVLKKRLVTGHKDWCGWMLNPCPEEFIHPPLILSFHYFKGLVNTSTTLSSVGDNLPFLNIRELLEKLDLKEQELSIMFQNNTTITDTHCTAALLTLFGWTYEKEGLLRCSLCLRKIGLWNCLPLKRKEEFLALTEIEKKRKELHAIKEARRKAKQERQLQSEKEIKEAKEEEERKVKEAEKKANEAEEIERIRQIEIESHCESMLEENIDGSDEEIEEEMEKRLLEDADNGRIVETHEITNPNVVAGKRKRTDDDDVLPKHKKRCSSNDAKEDDETEGRVEVCEERENLEEEEASTDYDGEEKILQDKEEDDSTENTKEERESEEEEEEDTDEEKTTDEEEILAGEGEKITNEKKEVIRKEEIVTDEESASDEEKVTDEEDENITDAGEETDEEERLSEEEERLSEEEERVSEEGERLSDEEEKLSDEEKMAEEEEDRVTDEEEVTDGERRETDEEEIVSEDEEEEERSTDEEKLSAEESTHGEEVIIDEEQENRKGMEDNIEAEKLKKSKQSIKDKEKERETSYKGKLFDNGRGDDNVVEEEKETVENRTINKRETVIGEEKGEADAEEEEERVQDGKERRGTDGKENRVIEEETPDSQENKTSVVEDDDGKKSEKRKLEELRVVGEKGRKMSEEISNKDEKGVTIVSVAEEKMEIVEVEESATVESKNFDVGKKLISHQEELLTNELTSSTKDSELVNKNISHNKSSVGPMDSDGKEIDSLVKGIDNVDKRCTVSSKSKSAKICEEEEEVEVDRAADCVDEEDLWMEAVGVDEKEVNSSSSSSEPDYLDCSSHREMQCDEDADAPGFSKYQNITNISSPEQKSKVSANNTESQPQKRISNGCQEDNLDNSKPSFDQNCDTLNSNQKYQSNNSQRSSPSVSDSEDDASEDHILLEQMEKSLFDPLEEHRPWCSWIASSSLFLSTDKLGDTPGYKIIPPQLKSILPELHTDNLMSSEKYIQNIEGLRAVRSMLYNWTVEEEEENSVDMEL